VAEGGGSITVFVSRANGGDGPAEVSYTTRDGTATADDYVSHSGTLTWGTGDTADQPITIFITDDTLNEGKESFSLTLSNPTGNAVLGSQAATTVTIAKDDGKTVNATDKSPQIAVTDPEGDQETVRLGGGLGSLTYYLTNGQGPVAEIDLAGTDPTKSTLAITVKKPRGGTGDGLVGIGEIDGTGLKSLSLGKNYLDGTAGDGIHLTGFLGSLKLGDITNGADIFLAGPAPKAGQTIKIAAGAIGDGTDIAVTGAPLGSLTAVRVGTGTITAPSVGTITVKGRAKTKTTAAIPGDFASDLTVTGPALTTRAPALGSLTLLTGSVAAGVDISAPTIGTIRVAKGDFAGNITATGTGIDPDPRKIIPALKTLYVGGR